MKGVAMPSPVEHVNPLQGSDSQFDFSRGNCLPLTSLPWAFTNWCPQTDEGRWLFDRRSPRLQGFRATRQPSPWIGDYGHFTIMPQTGRRMLGATARSSHCRELVSAPHYLRADLTRYRTTLELAPTERCAVLRCAFPDDEPARVIVQPGPGVALMTFNPYTATLSGFTRSTMGGAPPNFACYFVARFDQPPADWGLFVDGQQFPQERERVGERVGAYVEFVPLGAPVVLRVATSFISLEQAELNLEREVGARSLEEVRDAAELVWREALGAVEIEGASDAQRRTFYTALYRSLLYPRAAYEHDEAGAPIHYSPYTGEVLPGVLYSDNGFWDTFRTVYPLLSLLFPRRLAEMIEGWVQCYREGGWLPTWSSPGYRACMIGTHLDAVIADAVVKGVRGFDAETAFQAVLKDCDEEGDPGGAFGRSGVTAFAERGYVPAGEYDAAAARTQEYAYTDFCAAQIAASLGSDGDARRLFARALNYRNVFDPVSGFMRARLGDGAWTEPFDPCAWDTDAYIEGSAWQYSWQVPHDPAGLIALHGGPERFAARLDEMLATEPYFRVGGYSAEIHEMTEMAAANFGQYAHSNQPVHHVLYLFACAGQPHKTQYWVRRILAELYTPETLPGDEDNGEMSAWYVLSALGFYPLCVGHPSYVLGSPLFRRATVRLESGATLTIDAPENSAENVYVQGARWNGAEHRALWIGHEALVGGGTLSFAMGAEPRADLQLSPEDLPFSLSSEAQ
jgi:predicted alpha-1,2-mannosidase